MATVTITGATGLIGRRLTALLVEKGYKVIALSRHPQQPIAAGVQMAQWDIAAQTIDAAAIEQADYIVHLAGAGVADKRWRAAYKKEIVESRTRSAALLEKALQQYTHNVQAVISASGIGWYGADTPQTRSKGFEETAPASPDFLGETCRLWEQAIDRIGALGIRTAKIRTGIALSNDGGAFAKFKQPLRFGIATIFGSGEQMVSWIHLEDLCRIYLHAIEHNNMQGAYNAVAPVPVTNKQLMLAMARQLRGKFYVPIHVPSVLLKIALGQMSVEILKSTTVHVGKLRNTGFTFLYPSLDAALNVLLK